MNAAASPARFMNDPAAAEGRWRRSAAGAPPTSLQHPGVINTYPEPAASSIHEGIDCVGGRSGRALLPIHQHRWYGIDVPRGGVGGRQDPTALGRVRGLLNFFIVYVYGLHLLMHEKNCYQRGPLLMMIRNQMKIRVFELLTLF